MFQKKIRVTCGVFSLLWVMVHDASACKSPIEQTFSAAYGQIISGELGQAQLQLDKLFRQSPHQPEVLNNLAALAQLRGNLGQARELINEASKHRPAYASIFSNRELLSERYSLQASRIQLIANLPCQHDQHLAMTVAMAKTFVSQTEEVDFQLEKDELSASETWAELRGMEFNFLADAEPNKPDKPDQPDQPDELVEPDASIQTAAGVNLLPLTLQALPTPIPLHDPATATATAIQESESLQIALQSWAKAWREQSTQTYLNFYARTFDYSGTGASTRAQWKQRRTQRLARYQSIQLELTDIQYIKKAAQVVAVSFNQRWQGDALIIFSPGKTMHWKFHQGRWEILTEKSIDLPRQ